MGGTREEGGSGKIFQVILESRSRCSRRLLISTATVPRAVGTGSREKERVFETLIFFKRPDVAVLSAFSGNTIACSATSAPSKALKLRPPAAKHYKLRHSCTLPNSLRPSLMIIALGTQFHVYLRLNSVLNVKALVGAFNQEKARELGRVQECHSL